MFMIRHILLFAVKLSVVCGVYSMYSMQITLNSVVHILSNGIASHQQCMSAIVLACILNTLYLVLLFRSLPLCLLVVYSILIILHIQIPCAILHVNLPWCASRLFAIRHCAIDSYIVCIYISYDYLYLCCIFRSILPCHHNALLVIN